MIFERPPQPFDKYVVLDAPATIHADGDVMLL